MKKNLNDEDVQQAIGRILSDRPYPGDGNMLLQALEHEREMISPVLLDACALSAGWGRRKLAHDLIEIARKEYQRVHSGLPSANAISGTSGSASPGSSLSDPSGLKPGVVHLASRRRGPILDFSLDDTK